MKIGIPFGKVELHNGDSCMCNRENVLVLFYRESKVYKKHSCSPMSQEKKLNLVMINLSFPSLWEPVKHGENSYSVRLASNFKYSKAGMINCFVRF